MARKKQPVTPDEPSSLSSWSDIIRRQGEERRAEQDRLLEEMTKRLPGEIAALTTLKPKMLIAKHDLYSRKYTMDPREMKLWQTLAKASRKEILRRMKKGRS